MEPQNRFSRAMEILNTSDTSKEASAATLAKQLASSSSSALSIFQSISELTRPEALEVLVYLTFCGPSAVSAAVRIAATLRSLPSAWEALLRLIPHVSSSRDLVLTAISFGARARFSRDWCDCIQNAVDGNNEAKLTMAALLESRDVAFNSSEILRYEEMPVNEWNSQRQFSTTNPSLGRELAWCSFAARRQKSVEASQKWESEKIQQRYMKSEGWNWIQKAEPDDVVLNDSYFRMFGALTPIRKRIRDEDTSNMEIQVVVNDISTSSSVEFAITSSVLKVFYEFSRLSWACKPILIEGPHGCGKSASISKLADITFSGSNSDSSGRTNICFVHMDTVANKDNSSDFSSLVGAIVPLPEGGGFRWQHGPIGHAIVNGSWLVLENMDCDYRFGNSATSALVSQFTALRPGDEFKVASRSEPLCVGVGFRLFATRTLRESEKNGTERWTPPGGWESWDKIHYPSLSEDEQLSMLRIRFPTVSDCVPRVLQAISRVQKRLSSNRKAMDREPTLREAVSICERLVTARQLAGNNFTPEAAMLECLDVLVAWVADTNLKDALTGICSDSWSLTPNMGKALLSDRDPRISTSASSVRIGRCLVSKAPLETIFDERKKLAMTKHTARTLERLAMCVSVGESVLLSGETGTGKTSTLQELARLTRKELVIVNMSKQSDISDLLGGFRPLEVAAVLPELVKRFEEAFCRRMSSKKNARFFDAVHRAARSPKLHKRALLLMQGAIDALPSSIRSHDQDSALEWNRIEKMISRLNKLLPQTTNNSGVDEPPRKRQRSNIDDSDEETSRINFEYADGALVSALRAGHWVLLDEVNLAPVEVLDHLVSLIDHNMVVVPNEEGETVRAANGFALFAAMNPPTDFGKRPLAKELRSRLTEFYVEDIDDQDDLEILVAHRLFGVDMSSENSRRLSAHEVSLARDVALFYLSARNLARAGSVDDSSGKCARFSLRTLSYMLSFVVNLRKFMKANDERRALYEGACFAFATPLPRASRPPIIRLAAKHLLEEGEKKRKKIQPLNKVMNLPESTATCTIMGFPVEVVSSHKDDDTNAPQFIVTSAVSETLSDVCRALIYGVERVPILLQGPTSAGKTSLVSYLAYLTGNKLIRINNHEHTDLSEYLGCYVATDSGSLEFREGPLVRAVREGHWIVLDELNLAPPEVLESLNRLLDDNKEIRIPETGEVIKAHRNFTLFATQNPPGIYAGRKELSRAFRGRFIEIQVDELPDDDLIEIIKERCAVPPSFAKRMVAVMRELQTRRRGTHLFSGKGGFVTARDMFRWGGRNPSTRQELAIHGYFLLGERARNSSEREIVRDVLISKIGVDPELLSDSSLYGNFSSDQTVTLPHCGRLSGSDLKDLVSKVMSRLGIALTPHLMRMVVLLIHCAANNEPALLVGPTGTGKTTACSLIAALMNAQLLSVNCHQHTESSDLVGGFRPCRRKTEKNSPLFEWADGPLVNAMIHGHCFLMDEINMADDAVVERLNAVLESSRTLMLPEKSADSCVLVGHSNFRVFGTMNPSGDFGKKELSPALRNRFTELWIPAASSVEDFLPVIRKGLRISENMAFKEGILRAQIAMKNILIWMSELDSTRSQFRVNSYKLSLRDVSVWSNFIYLAVLKTGMDPMVAFAHGARLVFLDGLRIGANSSSRNSDEVYIWERVLQEVPYEFQSDASHASFNTEQLCTVSLSENEQEVKVGPFHLDVRAGTRVTSTLQFCTTAPCTRRNYGRLARAMSIDNRPVLMEGPPGAGKTSLVKALASMVNVPLARINLSESTEMSDLIGGDVPGPSPGSFCFRQGELLRAMEFGKWVLLDEMNLASQSVLEGLNSLLDHRRSVFVPELATEVVAHSNFRIFAAQNPVYEGCGRRGLPQSFLNRFVKVSIEAPADSDLVLIAAESFPEVEHSIIEKVVRTISRLRSHLHQTSSNYQSIEFGLRQVLRWCSLLADRSRSSKAWSLTFDPLLCFDVVVLKALQPGSDRDTALDMFHDEFGKLEPSPSSTPSIRRVDGQHVRIGKSVLSCGRHLSFDSLSGFDTKVDPSLADCMQAMSIAATTGWPCIVSGESTPESVQHSSQVVESLAAISGHKLFKVKGGAFLDVDDLLGGYTQQGLQAEFEFISRRLLFLHQQLILGYLSNGDSSENALKKLTATEKIMLTFNSTKFSDIGLSDQCADSVVENCEDALRQISFFKELEWNAISSEEATELSARIDNLRKSLISLKKRNAVSFGWEKSELLKAIERGDWVLFEDANHCSSSVLDRLNPLLEISGNSTQGEVHFEPLMLPEAPPNPDGTCTSVTPHSTFRIFFVLDNALSAKLSRAIVDRSVTVRLLNSEMSTNTTARNVSCSSGLNNSTGNPKSDGFISALNHSSELSRPSFNLTSIGIADFDLTYTASIMGRDACILQSVFPMKNYEDYFQAFPFGEFSFSRNSADSTLNVESKDGRPDFSMFNIALCKSLVRMFILGSSTFEDFQSRCSLLTRWHKSLAVQNAFDLSFLSGITIDSSLNQGRMDMCIDPVYGLDSNSAEQPDRRLCERIKFRFDVIVLSELIQACKSLLFDIDNRSLHRDIVAVESQRLSILPQEKYQLLTTRNYFVNIAFRVVKELLNLVDKFYSYLMEFSSNATSLTLPNEQCWIKLFISSISFIKFVRTDCKTQVEAAHGMLVIKAMHDACLHLIHSSTAKLVGEILQVLSLLESACDGRPKYEQVSFSLPMSKNEYCVRAEREILKILSMTKTRHVQRSAVSKALVSLSTLDQQVDEKFKNSMSRLMAILRKDNEISTTDPPLSIDKCTFPIWLTMLTSQLELSSLKLEEALRESKSRADASSLVVLSKSSTVEFSLNPYATVFSQIFVQRLSWVLLSKQLGVDYFDKLYLESRISGVKSSIFRLQSELDSNAPDYLFASCSSSAAILSSLVSCAGTSSVSNLASLPRPEDAIAVASSFITGDMFSSSDQSSLRRRLGQLLSCIEDLGIVASGGTNDKFLFYSFKTDAEVMKSLEKLCGKLRCRKHGPREGESKLLEEAQTALKYVVSNSERMNPTAMSWICGLLSIIVGTERIFQFSDEFENLSGVDPSTIAAAEVELFSQFSVTSAADSAACWLTTHSRLGGDDVTSCIPKLRADDLYQQCIAQIKLSRARIVSRPADFAPFSEFVTSVPRFVGLVSNESAISTFLTQIRKGLVSNSRNIASESMKERIINIAKGSFELSATLLEPGGDLGHFRDVGGSLCLGIREVQYGTLLLAKAIIAHEFSSDKSHLQLSGIISKVLRYPQAAFQGNDILDVFNQMKLSGLDAVTQAVMLRYMATYSTSISDKSDEFIASGFSHLVYLWKCSLMKEETENELKNSLFVVKEKARMESAPGMNDVERLEDDEERDFEKVFKTDVPEVDLLVSGETSEDNSKTMQVADDSLKEEEIQPGNLKFSLEASTVWQYHRELYEMGSNTVREEALLEVLKFVGQIRNYAMASTDSGKIMGTLSACAISANLNPTKSSTNSSEISTYNFYKDDNLAEVSKMKAALSRFIDAIAVVQTKYFSDDGDHPALNLVTETAARALKATSYTLSLGTLVAVLETVLRKADEWERLYATKEMSLNQEIKELSRMALRWRHIEVQSWPNLLRSREELCKRRAEKWFYRLYDSLIRDRDEEYEFELTISTMDQFLRSSPQGEFETRVRMMQSLSNQLCSNSLSQHIAMGNTLSGLVQLYSLFLTKIKDRIDSATEPIKKKMDDFSRLTNWEGKESLGASVKSAKGVEKDLEYFRLKSKSEKVRRKLHKLCRELDIVYNTSSFEVISNEITKKGSVDLLSETAEGDIVLGSRRKIDTTLHEEFTPIPDLNDISTLDVSGLPLGTRLGKCKKLAERMQTLASRASNISKLENAGDTCSLLREQIRSRAHALRNSDAGILVKKRAFVDLLKSLEKAGVSPFENPATKLKEKPVYWLGLRSPFQHKSTTELVNYYFFYIGNRLQRLRAVSDGRVRNQDITPGESNKTIAYSCNLFIRAAIERERLYELHNSIDKAKLLAAQFAGYRKSSSYISLTDASNLLENVKRIESVRSDVRCVLRIVEGQRFGLEKLCSQDARNFSGSIYGLLSAKQNMTNFITMHKLLAKSDSQLDKFLSASSVQALLKCSATELFLITLDFSTWYKDAFERLLELSSSLDSYLHEAYDISSSSVVCSLLRPITAFLRNIISSIAVEASQKSDSVNDSPSGQNLIYEKCEHLVEQLLKSTQAVLGTNENIDQSVLNGVELTDDGVPCSFMREASDLLEHSSILSGVKKIEKIMLEISELVKDSYPNQKIEVAINSVGFFTQTYLNTIVRPFARSSSNFHLQSLALLKTLTSLFVSLSEEGYCRLPDVTEDPVDDDVEIPDTVDGVGFGDIGDGDASMAQDVSAEIEDEEQLLGLRNEEPEQEGENDGERTDNGETGVDMQTDFDGKLEDKERADDDQNEDSAGEEDLEKTFGGEQDENAIEIDERLWDSDRDQDQEGSAAPEPEEGKIESGNREGDSTLRGKENSDSASRSKPQTEAKAPKEKGTDGSISDHEEENHEDANDETEEVKEEEPSDGRKGKPKMNENDFMSDEEGDRDPGDPQASEDKIEDPLSEQQNDSEVRDSKEDLGDDANGMNDDDAMMGDATEQSGDEPNSEGAEHKETRTADNEDQLNDEVMDDLEMENQGNEPSSPMDIASDGEDGDELNSAMDDLPEEKLDRETELGPNTEDTNDNESTDDNQHAVSGDTGEQNMAEPNTRMMDGGEKTTPGTLESQNVAEDAHMFSNPEGIGGNVGLDQKMDVDDATGDGNDGGDVASSGNQTNRGPTAKSQISLEEFDAFPKEHDPNPFRERVERGIGEDWEKCLNVLESQADEANEDAKSARENEPMKESMTEFTNEHDESKKVALGPATEEQHQPLPEMEQDESDDGNEDKTPLKPSTEEAESAADMDTRKSGGLTQQHQKKQNENENENELVPSDDVTMTEETSGVENLKKHPVESAIEMLESLNLEKSIRKHDGHVERTSGEHAEIMDECREEDKDQGKEMSSIGDETSLEERKADFFGMWRKLVQLTESDSIALSEQLRLVLEPTVRAGLAGSFKTGKRLDMKKVIDFVASDFRRDRIWLRRVRPTKRSYDVLVAIDNSKSMTESGAGAVGLAGLALLTSALAKLEVGRVGILKFGAGCEVVRGIDDAFQMDENAGADVLSKFSFEEEKTNFLALLDTAHEILTKSKGTSLDEDIQLLFIISDGKLSEREELQKRLRQLGTSNVLVAFIVVNSNESEESNIFNVKQVSFGSGGEVKFTPYMSEFPFRFYTVIHDVKQLPNILGDALRQWLELTASNA